MTNSLINIAQTLTQRLNTSQQQPTQLADMMLDVQGKKQLNYEIMFQILMGECEKHILENSGNPVVDEFRDSILTKFSTLVSSLTK